MSCLFKRNNKGEVYEVVLPNGKKSKLFEQIASVPNFSNEQAVKMYKNIFSDKFLEDYGQYFPEFTKMIKEADFSKSEADIVIDNQMKEIDKSKFDKLMIILQNKFPNVPVHILPQQKINAVLGRSWNSVTKGLFENEATISQTSNDLLNQPKELEENGFNVKLNDWSDDRGQFLSNPQGVVYGFVRNGEVFINSDTAINANAPIHEFGHVWMNVLKTQNIDLYNRILDSVKSDRALMDSVRNNPNYAHLLNDNAVADEVIAIQIGNFGEKSFLSVENQGKLRQLFNEFWNWLKGVLGKGTPIEKWDNEKWSKVSVEDLAKYISDDILTGKPINIYTFENGTQYQFGDAVDKFPDLVNQGEFLERQGKTNKEIFNELSVFRGVDNKWKYVIDDNNDLDDSFLNNFDLLRKEYEIGEGVEVYVDTHNFSNVKSIAEGIIKGKYLATRLDSNAEKGRINGGSTLVEATLIAEAVSREIEIDDAEVHKLEQDKELERYAKENGLWFEDSEYFGELIGKGVESDVYKNGNKIIKNHSMYMNETPLEFFDRIAIHNATFPETNIKVLGFASNEDSLSVIVEQDFIESNESPTKEELDVFMIGKGFTKSNDVYFNDKYVFDDVSIKNAFILENGKVMVFDSVGTINSEIEDFGGNQEYGKMFSTNINDIYKNISREDSNLPKEDLNTTADKIKSLSEVELVRLLKNVGLIKDTNCK